MDFFCLGLVLFSVVEIEKLGAYKLIQQAAGLSNFNDIEIGERHVDNFQLFFWMFQT